MELFRKRSCRLTENWPKAILLDFYGTVVEEIRTPVEEICRQIADVSAGAISEKEVVSYWARVFIGLCSHSFGPAFQLQKTLEQRSLEEAFEYFQIGLDSHSLSRLLSEYRSCPTLFPESRSVLSHCRIPICLLTNIDNSEIRRAVSFTGLDFAHTVTSEDCQAYKPRPELFKEALTRLRLNPQDVLHVGDSLNSDIQGAREMGIPVLWINRRKTVLSAGAIQPDYTSTDLNGMLDILDKAKTG
jgi:2-haloalkanoic acid dehalogenase type II